jgi:hypothetical protein
MTRASIAILGALAALSGCTMPDGTNPFAKPDKTKTFATPIEGVTLVEEYYDGKGGAIDNDSGQLVLESQLDGMPRRQSVADGLYFDVSNIVWTDRYTFTICIKDGEVDGYSKNLVVRDGKEIRKLKFQFNIHC